MPDVQRVQSQHRDRLIETWDIAPGSRILEIGCGQGDMTAALAKAVGPQGHVLAVDCANRAYGAPMTLGEATDLLKASPMGRQIEFRFEFDFLDQAPSIAPGSFDYVVLAHSSWYFESLDQLERTLRAIESLAPKLCFAEWDLEPRSFEQTAHMLAILIQAQVEAFKTKSLANVRTPFTRDRLKKILESAGWTLVSESSVDSQTLQDADWEIAACLSSSLKEARTLALPPKFLTLLEDQIATLKQIAAPKGNTALKSYSLVASNSKPRPLC